MENKEQLIPIAMKESVAFRTAALIQGGYVQVDDTIQCPLCDERFVLLLDSKRDSDSEAVTGKQKEKTISFFREMIQQDHINDHPHWQFRMTARWTSGSKLRGSSDKNKGQSPSGNPGLEE